YAKFSVDANASITLFPEAKGYLIENWSVGEVTNSDDKDFITLTPVPSSCIPINYTINYYDGDKLMHTDTNITVDSKDNFYEPTKKGYKLTSWTNNSGVDMISPGPIDTFYLYTKGTSDNEYTVNLYAVWEATSTPSEDPAEPETPTSDTSPATGDSTPIFLIISLIVIAGLGIIMALKRKNL
ncbi:MAG: LPXTG cell wall anchor domain-containing protein, partial [Bacillota bacterium]|nr:LPXTG cell wall anchor domain-containing protein [Bacillota bacterium]